MIVLKRHTDLEKMLPISEFDITRILSRSQMNKFAILFDKKMEELEKELNILYNFLKDFEISGKTYDMVAFNFNTNSPWAMRIPRSVNPEIRFIHRQADGKLLLAAYSTQKKQAFVCFPKERFVDSPLDSYDSKYLEELLFIAEKITNKIFDREIGGLINKNIYEVNYLCRFLYQNLKKENKKNSFMENSFKVKDVEEYIELEILKHDFKKPTLPKSIQRLKK